MASDTQSSGDDRQLLYLHIGHYKTGTSALQDYLSRHARQLKAKGYLYPAAARPKNNPTNHGHVSLTLAREHGFVPPPWYSETITVDEAFRAFHQEAQKHPDHAVILSSEEFVQLALRDDPAAALADLKARLSGYRVRVVFYIREPFSLLKSWYNQVNKGVYGTRNFPTFFMNLKPDFLSQEVVWQAYADAFGAENVLLRSYKDVGAAHVAGFLKTIGCDHAPEKELPLVNEAQSLEMLEITRLAKERRHSFDEAVVSDIRDVRRFLRRATRISEAYDRLAAKSDVAIPSRLGAVEIIAHYTELLRPMAQHMPLSQAEAVNMRDLALKAERQDMALAAALMEVAHLIRPNGQFITEKLTQYKAALDA